jgi:hypothetical protein
MLWISLASLLRVVARGSNPRNAQGISAGGGRSFS